jgi:peptide/nickel transport system permease protein
MKRFGVFLLSRPIGMAAVAVIVILYLVMIFAESVAPYQPTRMFPERTYHPPNARLVGGKLVAQEWVVTNTVNWSYAPIAGRFHEVKIFGKSEPFKLWGIIEGNRRLFSTEGYPLFLMGSDHLGRDVFSRVVHGSRISLTLGLIVTAFTLTIGVFLGGLAGYYGGLVDAAIMRTAELLILIPSLYLLLLLRALLLGSLDSGQMFMVIMFVMAGLGWSGTARMIRA